MDRPNEGISTELTWDTLPPSCHVCLIYDDDEEREEVVAEYLAAGIRKGEQIRYMTDGTLPEKVRSWLEDKGIVVPESGDPAAFGVFDAGGFYCPDGRFDPLRLIQNMPGRFELLKKAGFRGSRACGEMSWALRGIPGSERLTEYENLLNTVGGDFPHNGMCQYDARAFDGATIYRILQMHPLMIAKGQIVRNPFYTRPEETAAVG
jgi:hypothetical protein